VGEKEKVRERENDRDRDRNRKNEIKSLDQRIETVFKKN